VSQINDDLRQTLGRMSHNFSNLNYSHSRIRSLMPQDPLREPVDSDKVILYVNDAQGALESLLFSFLALHVELIIVLGTRER